MYSNSDRGQGVFTFSFATLLLYLVMLLVRPHEFNQETASGIAVPYNSLILAIAFIGWILGERKEGLKSLPNLLVILLVLCMAISVAANGWLGGSVQVFNTYYPRAILFILVATMATSIQRMRVIFTLLVACALVMVYHGYQQVTKGIAWTGIPPIEGRIRYIGVFNDPNDLGQYFVLCLPLAIYLWKKSANVLARIAWMSCTGLLLTGIYWTNSRGTALAVCVMAFIYLTRRYGKVKGVVGLLLLSPIAALLPSRMEELNVNEESAYGRVDAWYEGLWMFVHNPVFGVGYGNFLEHHFRTAHNSFILVLAEMGLTGYLVWGLLLGTTLYLVMLKPRDREQAEMESEGSALGYAAYGFLVSAFFLSRSYSIPFFLVTSLATGYTAARGRGKDIERRIVAKQVPWILLSIPSFFVIVKILLLTT